MVVVNCFPVDSSVLGLLQTDMTHAEKFFVRQKVKSPAMRAESIFQIPSFVLTHGEPFRLYDTTGDYS